MTEIVKGLFGFSPQELAMQRDQELTTKANAFAQLSPEQRATQMLYKGGNQLAGAVGGMLGAQDPQMKKSSDLQGIMQSGDFNTVEGATAMAQQAAAMGYGNEAQQMYAHAQSLRKSAADLGLTEARTQQALREKQGADPLQQLIRTGKYTPASVQKYSETGNVSDLDNVEKADQTALSETSEGIFLVNKTTGEKIARVGSAPDRSTRVTVSPQIKLPADVNALASGYEKAIEGDVNVMNLAGTAKGLINQAAMSNNPTAWESARTQVAKAVGEGKLSNEDIARTGIDPTLVGGVRDWIEKKTVGVPDANTQKALFVVASYLEKNASGRVAEKRNNRIKMAKQVNPDIDAESMFPDYSKTAPPVGGGGTIVDFKDFGKKAK
jgi:hypothetical protein